MARDDGKIRCTICGKYRDPEDVRRTSVNGGATYRRGGRSYSAGICRTCCVDLVDSVRLYRYAHPRSFETGEYRGPFGESLDGHKEACEKFGLPVSDLPRDTFDRSKPFDRPEHPIRFDRASEFSAHYAPGVIERIKDHWRSLGATAVRKVAMEYYEWRDDQWVTTLDGATDVVMGILSRIPGARPNRAHVRADIDQSHFADDPDFRFSEEQLIERLIVDANGSIPIDDAYDMVADELLAIFPLDY